MSGERWWVEAQGRAWGPYPSARLPAFRDEGRLGPDSRVGRDPQGPFARAADAPELAALFGGGVHDAVEELANPAPSAESSANRDGSEREVPGREAAAEVEAPASHTLLVVSDAPEADLPALEAALARCGEVVRVRPGLWLLRAGAAAAPLRNALSRGLRAGAMLLVVEAPLPAAAWFALEGDTDRALRRLWAGG